jgi:hypothetical protein
MPQRKMKTQELVSPKQGPEVAVYNEDQSGDDASATAAASSVDREP